MKPVRISLKVSHPERIYPTLTRLFKSSSHFKIPFHLQSDWLLALFEGIQNAFQHGGAALKKKSVRVELFQDGTLLKARIFDQGAGFVLRGKKRKPSSSAERGRGLAIIRQLTDSLAYKKGKTENCLIFQKKILPPDKRYEGTDLLQEVSRRLTQAPSLEKVYEVILKKLIEIFNVERASIMIYDPKEAALKVVAARGLSPSLRRKIRVKGGEGVSGGVFARSRPLLIQDLKRQKEGKKGRAAYESHSFISAPLILFPSKVGEERLGVLNLTDRRDGSLFTKRDLKLLSTIAGQSAAFIKIGQLMDQLKQAEKFERELTVVREVQRKLLPTHILSPLEAEIAGEAILNERGGGDYFDVVRDPAGAYFLVVADVTGHSLASALTMAHFRSAFRMLAPQHSSPKGLLATLNSQMFEDLVTAEHFICVSLIRFLPDKGEVAFAGAGAVPLLLYGVSRKELGMVPSQGYPLGVDLKAPYLEESFTLSSGEGFIQCTDGVLDLPLKPQGKLGLEGVKKLVLTHQHYAPAEMIARLRKNLRRKLSMRPPPDDITVLVTKMR